MECTSCGCDNYFQGMEIRETKPERKAYSDLQTPPSVSNARKGSWMERSSRPKSGKESIGNGQNGHRAERNVAVGNGTNGHRAERNIRENVQGTISAGSREPSPGRNADQARQNMPGGLSPNPMVGNKSNAATRGSWVKRMMHSEPAKGDSHGSTTATNAEPERGSWLNRMTRAGSREGSPDHSADRGSWMQRMTRAGSREASPDHATDRGSWMRRMTGTGSAEGSPIQSIGPGSWIHRLTSHETSDHAHHEPYIGQHAVALYDNIAMSNVPPCYPDPRTELDLTKGMKLDLIELQESGWAIVRKRPHKREYFVPGNYISTDGHTPCYHGCID